MDEIISLIESSARILEAVGICVILLGTLAATAVFLWRLWKQEKFAIVYTSYRRGLGRAILLGLEFLVGADIIGTVAVEPSYENLGVLGLIVVIRTFLSFSLEVEIEGRWPWNRSSHPAKALELDPL